VPPASGGIGRAASSAATGDFARQIPIAIRPEGKVLHDWDDVHVKTHAADVLVYLRELVLRCLAPYQHRIDAGE